MAPVLHERTLVDEEEPSVADLENCRTIADALPKATWLLAVVAMCEKFAYCGFLIVLRMLLILGALGLGQRVASLLVNCFQCLSYITPIPAAVVADQYLGKYKTLVLSLCLYSLALSVLTVTSIPMLEKNGSGLPGVIACMIVVGLGIGGVRSTLPPLLAEQCTSFRPKVRVLKKGERVIVTHEETLEFAFNVYYWACNLGSLSMVASTLITKYIGYWLAFLIASAVIFFALLLLIVGRKTYTETKSRPSVTWACRASFIAIKCGFSLDAARPETLLAAGKSKAQWDDLFINEMKIAVKAARIGIPFVFYWLSQGQLVSNTISQAGMMQTYGVPNDLLPVANALAVVVLLPIVTHVLNPALRRWRLPFPPVTRIAVGFMFEALAMAYAAGVQGLIYASPPCYSQPLLCEASDGGEVPNQVNFAIQLPVYILEGFSEIFANPAITEYTFIVAPGAMKSVFQAVISLTAAVGFSLDMALSPLYYNPAILVVYASFSGLMVLCTIGTFFFL